MGRTTEEVVLDLEKSINEKYGSIDARIRQVEQDLKTGRVNPAEPQGKKSFQFARLIRGMSLGEWNQAKTERDIFEGQKRAAQERAQEEEVDSKGGFLVPAEYRPELIELRRAASVLDKLPITHWTGLTGSPVEVPSETGDVTAYWGKENTAPTESNQTYGREGMTPKKVTCLVKIPNRLLRRSSPAVEQIIRKSMMKVAALKIDLAGLKGTGNSSEPRGISNSAPTSFTFSGAMDYPKLIDMASKLDEDNVEPDSRGWAAHPILRRELNQILDANDRPIFQPYLSPPREGRLGLTDLLGYQFETTTQLASASSAADLFFGYWPDLVMGEWDGLEILASNQAGDSFTQDQTWVRLIQEVDFFVRRAKSFVHATDMTF